jgi:hypothetical protein
VRGQVGRGSTALLGRGGARTARVAAVTARWRVALLGAIGVVGVLALVLPDRLTPGYVAVIGLVALLLAAAVQAVAAGHRGTTDPPDPRVG